jgi:AraC-binding-like domain
MHGVEPLTRAPDVALQPAANPARAREAYFVGRDASAAGLRESRRADEIAQGGADLVQVVWQQAGRCRSRQGHHGATLEAGAWMVLDAGRDYMIEFSHDARCLLMLVPRSRCAGWLGAVDALAGMALASSGPTRIASSVLGTLLRDRRPMDGRSERALHDAVVALIDHALQMELIDRKLRSRRGARSIWRRCSSM